MAVGCFVSRARLDFRPLHPQAAPDRLRFTRKVLTIRKFLTCLRQDYHDYQQADDQGADHHSTTGARRPAPADELIYEIDDQRVILTKSSRGGKTDDPFRTFSEGNSAADAKAYGNL